MPEPKPRWVQFGCGLCAPPEWLNFDVSPRLWLQRLAVVGSLVPDGPHGAFPKNVLYGDIVSGLPLPIGYADLLYCSHVLEHLSLADFRTAIQNCRRTLRAGGLFRLVVPDLEQIVDAYRANADSDAAIHFMTSTGLGQKERPRGVAGVLRQSLGNSRHLWMWDYKAMKAELHNAGFSDVRRAAFGDSSDTAFRCVEDGGRWAHALGIECR